MENNQNQNEHTVQEEISEQSHPEETPLQQCETESEKRLQNWKRAEADLLNYKKDEQRRLQEFSLYTQQRIMSEIIDIADNFDAALKYIPQDFNPSQKSWSTGVLQIQKFIADFLAKYGVEKISVDGQKFNPEMHEAVTTEKSEDGRALLEEMRAGYTMHGKVIRPARVKIIE